MKEKKQNLVNEEMKTFVEIYKSGFTDGYLINKKRKRVTKTMMILCKLCFETRFFKAKKEEVK